MDKGAGNPVADKVSIIPVTPDYAYTVFQNSFPNTANPPPWIIPTRSKAVLFIPVLTLDGVLFYPQPAIYGIKINDNSGEIVWDTRSGINSTPAQSLQYTPKFWLRGIDIQKIEIRRIYPNDLQVLQVVTFRDGVDCHFTV